MSALAENPAARLYSIFAVYSSQREMTIGAAWALTLKVTEAELPFQLVGVLGLLREVRQQIEESNDPRSEPMLGHLDQLAACVLPMGTPLNHRVEDLLPSSEAHNALGFFAMSRKADEWDVLPEEDERQSLIESVQELIAAVLDEDGFPAHIRHAMLGRLHEVLQALSHLEVGGPDAVRRAAESLAVATALVPEDAPKEVRVIVKRVRQAANLTWNAVTVASVVTTLALNTDKMVDLPVIDAPPIQRQIPQSTSPAPSVDGSVVPADSPAQDGPRSLGEETP